MWVPWIFRIITAQWWQYGCFIVGSVCHCRVAATRLRHVLWLHTFCNGAERDRHWTGSSLSNNWHTLQTWSEVTITDCNACCCCCYCRHCCAYDCCVEPFRKLLFRDNNLKVVKGTFHSVSLYVVYWATHVTSHSLQHVECLSSSPMTHCIA